MEDLPAENDPGSHQRPMWSDRHRQEDMTKCNHLHVGRHDGGTYCADCGSTLVDERVPDASAATISLRDLERRVEASQEWSRLRAGVITGPPVTDPEHALVAKLGECYTEWLAMCRGDDQRWSDGLGHIEFAAHIHDLQNAVLARAMRRVYPDRYRP